MTVQFRTDPEGALRAYRRDGFHVERDMLDRASCAGLLAAAAAMPGRRAGDHQPLMHPHRWSPEFHAAFCRRDVVAVMERLVGGPVFGLQTTYYFGHPGTGGFANHQDNFFVEAAPWAFASAWIALADADRGNGGLYAFPGAHLLPRLPVARVSRPPDPNQDPNANTEECVMPPGYRPLDTVVPQGAVLFLHGNLPHGSHDNRSTRSRASLLCTFVRQGAAFRPGVRSGRVEVDLTQPFAPAPAASRGAAS